MIFQTKWLCQSNSVNPVFHKHVYISSFWKFRALLVLFWRLCQLHVVLCCRGAIVARSKTRTAYASYNVPRLRNFTSHFRWWGRKSLDRNHKYKASIRTRATSNSGKMVLLWGKKKVALFVMMYWNKSVKGELLDFEIHIIELLGWDNFVNFVKTSPTLDRVSSPESSIFSQKFRFSLSVQVQPWTSLPPGKKEKGGWGLRANKKEVLLTTFPVKDLPGQSRTPGRWEPQRPCWLLRSPKNCDIVDPVPKNIRNCTLLSFMPARCWMAPEMPTAM